MPGKKKTLSQPTNNTSKKAYPTTSSEVYEHFILNLAKTAPKLTDERKARLRTLLTQVG